MNKIDNPKIVFVTTPMRETPSCFPPVGSLSVITSLKQSGFKNIDFYDIDVLRPKYNNILDHIQKLKPDILAISAVVSTAYEFSKDLSRDIKDIIPDITIILGGQLGASAEILLKKTGVDFVCTGEGEQTMVDFVNCWKIANQKNDYENVKGLAFLDDENNLKVNPFCEPLKPKDIYNIDWSILEKTGHLEYLIQPKETSPLFGFSLSHDPRTHEPQRNGKTVAVLIASKGCVAKCTFCHRWDAGIRFIPVDIIMNRIDFFVEKYNLGFIDFGDENFGSDKKWLKEFLTEIKKRDLLWRVAGMRVNSISSEWAARMKDAGCTSIACGMETGSQKMLDIMQKVATVAENKSALEDIAENDLDTCLQLVLGMPGETMETVTETMEFASHYAQVSPKIDPNNMGVNFAQALPGTPLYEYARRKGQIGQSLEDEEKYLISVSNCNAREIDSHINFTDFPKLLLEKWHFDIPNIARNSYIKKWGLDKYNMITSQSMGLHVKNLLNSGPMRRDSNYTMDFSEGKEAKLSKPLAQGNNAKKEYDTHVKHFQITVPPISLLIRKKLIRFIPIFHPQIFWRFRRYSILTALFSVTYKSGIKYSTVLLLEYLQWILKSFSRAHKAKPTIEAISLRKILKKKFLPTIPSDNPTMEKLRKGR